MSSSAPPPPPSPSSASASGPPSPLWRVGCVSFLNARPLVEGLDDHPRLQVQYDVPSRLLDDLLRDRVDLALCPVIDYQLSPRPLALSPVGGICCDGPTLTVRLFSQVPFEKIRRVHADTDSHTSVMLMRIVLWEMHGVQPAIIPFSSADGTTGGEDGGAEDGAPPTLLLIGDKVVTRAPSEELYPYQLDLGEAWKRLTALPFVFATWMSRRERGLEGLAKILEDQRERNHNRIERIAEAQAPRHGWPPELARRYLGELLRYAIGEREMRAIELFWDKAHALGLIESARAEMVTATRSP